jgi:pilus assembly protein Flp/PilA
MKVTQLKDALIALWRNEEGLTTVEYAIAGGLVGLAVVVAFRTLGVTVGGVITAINTAITPAA